MQGVPPLGVVPQQAQTSMPQVPTAAQMPVSPFGWLNKKPQVQAPAPQANPQALQARQAAPAPAVPPQQSNPGLLMAAQQSGQINPYQGGQFNPRLHSIV